MNKEFRIDKKVYPFAKLPPHKKGCDLPCLLSADEVHLPVNIYAAAKSQSTIYNYSINITFENRLVAQIYITKKFLESIFNFSSLEKIEINHKYIEIIIHSYFLNFINEFEQVTNQDLNFEITEFKPAQAINPSEYYVAEIGSSFCEIAVDITDDSVNFEFLKFCCHSEIITIQNEILSKNIDIQVALPLLKEKISDGDVYEINYNQLVVILNNKYYLPYHEIKDEWSIASILNNQLGNKYISSETVFAIFDDHKGIDKADIPKRLEATLAFIMNNQIKKVVTTNSDDALSGVVVIHDKIPYLIIREAQ